MFTMKKRIAACLILLSLLTTLISACSQKQEPAQSQQADTSTETTAPTVQPDTNQEKPEEPKKLDPWVHVKPSAFGSLDDIIYAVGLTMGYWEEEGIDLKVEASAAGSSETKMVAAGRGDSCGASPYVLLPAIESGIPLISYFQVDSINFFCFGFHPDKGYKDIKDLAGKKIALGNIAWKNISDANLIAGGVDPNSVEYVVLGENRAQMTWDKQCDAVLTWEKEYQQWQGRGMDFSIIKGWDYLKGPANSLSTTAANLNNPEFLERAKRAVRGYAKSLYFIRCNPRAATQICLDMFPAITIEFDMAIRAVDAATAVHHGSGFQLKEGYGYGYHDPQAWDAVQDACVKADVITEKLLAEHVYTNQFTVELNAEEKAKIEKDANEYPLKPENKG